MTDTGPIEATHRQLMNELAGFLDELFNKNRKPDDPKIVFTLLVAESGRIEGGRVNYISNGHRQDVVNMMREMIGKSIKEGKAE